MGFCKAVDRTLRDGVFLSGRSVQRLDQGKQLILGGGSVAIEMATAFAALGTRVHVVEEQDRLLASEDPLITEIVERSLRSRAVSSACQSTKLTGLRARNEYHGGDADESEREITVMPAPLVPGYGPPAVLGNHA